MYFDHVAEEQQDKNFMIWVRFLLNNDPEQPAIESVNKHRQGKAREKDARCWGGRRIQHMLLFNEDGFEAIVWFTALGRAVSCTEDA